MIITTKQTNNWYEINWRENCVFVNKLQEKLVVAYKNKNWKEVHSTQLKLMMSFERRPLGIPNMIDRALQALMLLCFDPIVEEISDSYSFGFRKFRSTSDATQRI